MASYILRYNDDKYVISMEPVHSEGDWTWTDWLSRGVYMEGIRRLGREGFEVYPFVMPDNQEIVIGRFMVCYKTEEELAKLNYSLTVSGLASACSLQYVDEEPDGKKTLIFYLLP